SDFEENEVREALAFWRGAGLFSKKRGAKKVAQEQEKKADDGVKIVSSRPNYTSFDLANAVDHSPDFKSLVDYAEGKLEKLLNRADLAILYSFVDYLALPVDVVMLAIEACVREGKKSLRYIEKLLIALADDGIVTYEDADAYFVRRAEYLSYEGRVRAMCGFGARALTAAEKKLITAWKDEHKYTEEELVAAYEKTIAAINKPSISYMNKVLHTLRSTPAATAEDTHKTYDTESRFEAAVSRKKKKKTEEAE
ncbi:MAG: DnaD domain protein, partial [Clostridia bacterium]|nr:DnaD domain protein [Clostridia bacterium]